LEWLLFNRILLSAQAILDCDHPICAFQNSWG
jgi:hypothetical protein